ncbi:hypothetical protein [Gaoshiqia sediminis]|uniref:Uncharacterized protein n=1 Tax=Gaoshiqia sediminis TaxID=2986998 RepID=A0AA41YDV8_9BACT|nr:hypothetical protein [Gaoshiqia sediminis]MCW0484975.1 hypothetical protein [Gaoshiqia sediminis]
MATLKIKIDTKQNARLLKKFLQNIPFVKKIEDDLQASQPASLSQYDQLKEILDTIEPGSLYGEIIDPVNWQKDLRNEWETH